MATATASTMKLRPLGDRVVVKPSGREEMTKSGIVLPDTAKEKPQEGTILAAGPGKILDDGTREKMDVKVGQIASCTRSTPGTEFKVEGEELLIVSQKDILAIVGVTRSGRGGRARRVWPVRPGAYAAVGEPSIETLDRSSSI